MIRSTLQATFPSFYVALEAGPFSTFQARRRPGDCPGLMTATFGAFCRYGTCLPMSTVSHWAGLALVWSGSQGPCQVCHHCGWVVLSIKLRPPKQP